LRRTKPDLKRTFRCPAVPVVPALSIVFAIWLMAYLRWETWVRMGAWLVIGLLVYGLYGYRNTRKVMPGGSVDWEAEKEYDTV